MCKKQVGGRCYPQVTFTSYFLEIKNIFANGKLHEEIIQITFGFAGHDKVNPYTYNRVEFGSSHKGNFVDPDDYYSVFMEPVAVFRIKVLNPGGSTDFARLSPLKYERSNNLEQTIYPWFLSYKITSSKQVIFLNGEPYRVSYTE